MRTICGYCTKRNEGKCPPLRMGRLDFCSRFERRPIIGNHREIMAEAIGRMLDKNEFVHHINGNHSDNRLDNLFLCSPGEHIRIHRLMKKGVSRANAIFAILERRPESLIVQGSKIEPAGLRSDESGTQGASPAKTRISHSARGSR